VEAPGTLPDLGTNLEQRGWNKMNVSRPGFSRFDKASKDETVSATPSRAPLLPPPPPLRPRAMPFDVKTA